MTLSSQWTFSENLLRQTLQPTNHASLDWPGARQNTWRTEGYIVKTNQIQSKQPLPFTQHCVLRLAWIIFSVLFKQSIFHGDCECLGQRPSSLFVWKTHNTGCTLVEFRMIAHTPGKTRAGDSQDSTAEMLYQCLTLQQPLPGAYTQRTKETGSYIEAEWLAQSHVENRDRGIQKYKTSILSPTRTYCIYWNIKFPLKMQM